MIEPYLEAGFVRFSWPHFDTCRDAAAKNIYIDGRKAFMIVVKYSCFSDKVGVHENVSADVQYNVHADDKPVFNVDLLHAESPEQVIQFFTGIWRKMDCAFYD